MAIVGLHTRRSGGDGALRRLARVDYTARLSAIREDPSLLSNYVCWSGAEPHGMRLTVTFLRKTD